MKVWVDANPSMTAYVAEDGRSGVKQLPPNNTNNTAEYRAILRAILAIPEVTEIISDSQLVVKQLNREYHIKDDNLRELALHVWTQAKGKVKFTWIPRKENKAGKLLG